MLSRMTRSEIYVYELLLPGLGERPPDYIPRYGREKTLGPAEVGHRLMYPDVDGDALVLPEVEWEVCRIEESVTCDGRLTLRRAT
jgi:hypothetical protein